MPRLNVFEFFLVTNDCYPTEFAEKILTLLIDGEKSNPLVRLISASVCVCVCVCEKKSKE